LGSTRRDRIIDIDVGMDVRLGVSYFVFARDELAVPSSCDVVCDLTSGVEDMAADLEGVGSAPCARFEC